VGACDLVVCDLVAWRLVVVVRRMCEAERPWVVAVRVVWWLRPCVVVPTVAVLVVDVVVVLDVVVAVVVVLDVVVADVVAGWW
jgi:hypothetical protein